MLVTDYLSKDFIPPNSNQTVGHALSLIQEFNLSHIPIFEGLNFIGNLSKEILEDKNEDIKLSELKEFNEFYYMTSNGSLLEAVQNFHTHTTNLQVVLSSEMKYMGLLMIDDVISALSVMPFIAEPGAIIIVEVSQKQYSISEIAKIAESNNARIIGLFVISYEQNTLRIAIKLLSDNLASVSETFERFNYTVMHKFFNDEKEDMIKDRYQMLMKFLDI